MNIAFCINRQGLIGLGVTLSSLIRNCSDPSRLNLWFLCAGLTQKEKDQIKSLADTENFEGLINFLNFDPREHFSAFRSLHGDWTTYGRLLLPELLTENQVLYLDSDLVIEVDILKIENFDFNGRALAAVGGCMLKYNLESTFYIDKLGLDPELDSFNAGVLLFNLKLWREKNIKEACYQIGNQYPMELLSCDQTILNSIFAGDKFSKLPDNFNCLWMPEKAKPTVSDNMILHFVGAPKPWDVFGTLIHNGYPVWKKYLNKEWDSLFGHYSIEDWKKAWRIRRSYLRSLNRKIRSNFQKQKNK